MQHLYVEIPAACKWHCHPKHPSFHHTLFPMLCWYTLPLCLQGHLLHQSVLLHHQNSHWNWLSKLRWKYTCCNPSHTVNFNTLLLFFTHTNLYPYIWMYMHAPYMHTHTHSHKHIHTHTHTHTHTSTHTHAHACTHTHARTHACTHTCTTHTRTHAPMHAHTHTYTHVCIHLTTYTNTVVIFDLGMSLLDQQHKVEPRQMSRSNHIVWSQLQYSWQPSKLQV